MANPLTTSLLPRKDTDATERDGSTSTFGALVELAKPGVTGLVMLTMLCGALAAPGPRSVLRILVAMLGTALVVGAANALNMYLERESDAFMKRTASRPLPTRRLTPEAALWFAAATSIVGLTLLGVWVNVVTALFTGLALVSYVLAYTPLKRVTSYALHVGAIPGALPPLIGWTSVTGSVDARALALFAILFVWQLPHFLAIAMFRREEYARAGLVVMPNVRGVLATKYAIVFYAVLLLLVSLSPVVLGMAGIGYAIITGALGIGFLVQAVRGLWTTTSTENSWARRLFFASMPYLVLVYAAVVIGF